MSIYQDTPPDPTVPAKPARPNPIGALIILIVFGAVFYGAHLFSSRQVTDNFEEFSVTHPAYWSQRDATKLYQCEPTAVGGCVADYVLTGQSSSVEIMILRVFTFVGGNGLDNAAVQGGIDGVLNGMNATITHREDLTLSGLPAQRIEFSTTDGHILLFVAKPSLYLHMFFAIAEDQQALAASRADVEAFMQGVTFTTE